MHHCPRVGLAFEFMGKLQAGRSEAVLLPGTTRCHLGPECGPSRGRRCRGGREGEWECSAG